MYKYYQKVLKAVFVFCAVFCATAIFADTPHLDAVEDRLRSLAPGSEGTVWERTEGNEIAGYGISGSDWLLQSPNCWGSADCSGAEGAQTLADTIYKDISQAREWVDITTLVTYPDGIFQEAIVEGIKDALDNNPNITIRILGGTPPAMGSVNTRLSETASHYFERLEQDLGSYAQNARIVVAGVETSWLYSWNHSKIIAVDGKTAIVGGHNLWEGAYGQVENPISDISMRLKGPAAESAHKYADLLWDFVDENSSSFFSKLFYVELLTGNGFSWLEGCPKTHEVSSIVSYGSAEVLALGGLGFGVDTPGGTSGGLSPADDCDAACTGLSTDYVNDDAAYSVANPEEEGLRALIESATESVFLSQQDLIGICAPPISNSRYDARLFDVLADKLVEGVAVKIVLSSPGAKQGIAAPYSNMKKMTEITDILLREIQSRAYVDLETAKSILCANLQLAPIRIAKGVDTWANGNAIANHAKVISVDNEAFYIGSKNLYPATLQDYGYIVEDTKAAQEFKTEYQDVIWFYSKDAAAVDSEECVCNL
ncbi:MAG: phospholipase [bacterium]|nr:phospholipase [bacterium]